MEDTVEPKIIKANKSLQAKVGTGPLDERTVERCQAVMDNNDVDFTPLGMQFLNELKEATQKAKSGEVDLKQSVQDMTEPVMQLKANAKTFRYTLVGNLANVMLSFLEAIQEMDDGMIEIVDAHHKTLTAIIMKKMQGDGGEYGKQLEDELKSACKRYFMSRQKKAKAKPQS